MVAPILNAYEYQYMDSGVLLNGSASLPFIDVSSIQGLDMPNIESSDSDYDARHGGYVYAKYVGIRTIVIDGVLYANPASIDTTIELLMSNFMPREDDAPFYFRGSGTVQRYIMCKPVGLNYNLNNLRNYGACEIQIQLKAGDPVKYTDNPDVTVSSGTVENLTNAGNTDTYPVFELSGAASEIAIVKTATGEAVTLAFNSDTNDTMILDFKTRSCVINGIRNSSYLTSLGWWTVKPNSVANNFIVLSTAAELMVGGDCEANFTGAYAVGTSWTGLQQFTGDKHSGSKSLKMTRNKVTAGNGTVVVPTGVTGQAVGTYTVSVWLKGTIPHANIEVLNGATVVASLVLASVSSTVWQKYQLSYTLAAVGGVITIRLSDTGEVATQLVKNRFLLIDDFSIKSISSVVSATVHTKNGWL